jgi:hypothetical protein
VLYLKHHLLGTLYLYSESPLKNDVSIFIYIVNSESMMFNLKHLFDHISKATPDLA